MTARSSRRPLPPLADCLAALSVCPEVPRATLYRLAGALVEDPAPPGEGLDPGALARRAQLPASGVERALGFLAAEGAGAAARAREEARGLGARLVTLDQEEYPAEVRPQGLAPPALYVHGTLPPPGTPAIAVVGSRAMDAYGREAAAFFARELARHGVTVVSGFARGIDATAHRACLEAGGTTLAVLGCGLGVDYPRGHRGLGREIAARGALISEFACAEPPQTWSFPIRNRLIAALGEACLVVQASPRSGSLITAQLALDLGRDVFAVPGRIFDERATGTNALLRDGAAPALHPRDILERLGLALPRRAGERSSEGAAGREAAGRALPSSTLARRVLDALQPGEPLTLERLLGTAGRDGGVDEGAVGVDAVLGALLELELGGWVRRHPGPAFSRVA